MTFCFLLTFSDFLDCILGFNSHRRQRPSFFGGALQISKSSNDLKESCEEIGRMFVFQGESQVAHQTQSFMDVAV